MKKRLFFISILFSGIALSDDAYQWETALTLESIHNLSGGVKKDSAELANLDITLAIDTQAADLWESGEFFFYVLGNYGHDPAELTGGVQGISNIAADDSIKIYEFWYQHHFLDNHVAVLTGLHDFNSTFYSLDAASLFNHPSFGIGPDTSQATPSIFPTTAWTLHCSVELENLYGISAIYDGVPGDLENPRGTHIKFDSGDGLFYSIEMGFYEEGKYKMGIGYWQHSKETENPIDASLMDSNQGIYFIAEKYISENLAVFLQYGQADDETNQLEQYLGTGVVYNNWLREGDAVGLAYARVTNSDLFMNANPDLLETEMAYELSYALALPKNVSTQLSVYQIENPDMNPLLDAATAVGLRVVVSF